MDGAKDGNLIAIRCCLNIIMAGNKELANEIYGALLVASGVVGFSMVSKELFGEKITKVRTVEDFAKLSAGLTTSTLLGKYPQDNKWLPTDPFKTAQHIKL